MTDVQAASGRWTKADIFTSAAGVEPVGAMLLELGLGGYQVRDPADFEAFLEGGQGRWDYIDAELMKLRDAETVVTAYLAGTGRGAERLSALRSGLARLKAADAAGDCGRLECALTEVAEEDWANAWKRYYAPVPVGERLVVCPSWEEYTPGPGQTVIRLDPGMAFGSGTHDSTRMCLELLQEVPAEGARVLDLGCGSGILAVAAALLGAGSAELIDIEETAVGVAAENARINGVDGRCAFRCGDFAGRLGKLFGEERFDIVFANIVADVILAFLPDIRRVLAAGGSLIASGIIDAREPDMLRGLAAGGFTVDRRLESGGWIGLLCSTGPQ